MDEHASARTNDLRSSQMKSSGILVSVLCDNIESNTTCSSGSRWARYWFVPHAYAHTCTHQWVCIYRHIARPFGVSGEESELDLMLVEFVSTLAIWVSLRSHKPCDKSLHPPWNHIQHRWVHEKIRATLLKQMFLSTQPEFASEIKQIPNTNLGGWTKFDIYVELIHYEILHHKKLERVDAQVFVCEDRSERADWEGWWQVHRRYGPRDLDPQFCPIWLK